MGKVVLHIQKPKGNDAGTSAHIERIVMPGNADPERTYLNKEFIEFPKEVKNRTQAIQYRIENAGIKRKISHNQVRALQIMLSGTHEDMQQIQQRGKLNEWCKDNIEWLQNTFGKDNVVSAVLHMDEKTPHIHATVVPIVKGERRKAKAEENNGKKKYKKKAKDTTRLCADDIVSRDKLELYQDTYAEKMKKYGMERGIRGSEARHLSTDQYYRNLSKENNLLQEDILQLHQQKEKTEKELKNVKGEIRTDKLKGAAVNAATNLVDSVNYLLGNNKVKSLEHKKEILIQILDGKEKEIKQLTSSIQILQKQYKMELSELKEKYNKDVSHLNMIIDKANIWFPLLKQLLQMEKFCKAIGFADEHIQKLIKGKPVIYTGNLYSEEYRKFFKVEQANTQILKDITNKNILVLNINSVNISDWFKFQYQELKQSFQHNSKRGFRL